MFDHRQFYCFSDLKPGCEVYFLSSFWLSLLLFNKTAEGSDSDNCTVRHTLLRWNMHCIRTHSEILFWLPPSKLLLRRNTMQKTQVGLQCKKCGSISICRLHTVVLLVLLWYYLLILQYHINMYATVVLFLLILSSAMLVHSLLMKSKGWLIK